MTVHPASPEQPLHAHSAASLKQFCDSPLLDLPARKADVKKRSVLHLHRALVHPFQFLLENIALAYSLALHHADLVQDHRPRSAQASGATLAHNGREVAG